MTVDARAGKPPDPSMLANIPRLMTAYYTRRSSSPPRIARARSAPTTHRHDYMDAYVGDLPRVVDLEVVRAAKVTLGVDPLGGAGVHYWGMIGERYKLPLTVISDVVDPTFRFMTVDWDGKIRMDCSSPYAMQRLIALRNRFDVAWACDTDHDRHGVVARSVGLLDPNAYLAVAISYLLLTGRSGRRRPGSARRS